MIRKSVVGIIPARFGSTRFPGKPLHLIAGKPLLQWVLEGASASIVLDEVVVATDDARIESFAKSIGHRVVMTARDLPTGTDRVRAAVLELESQGMSIDRVVNVQGDEPLISASQIDPLIAALKDPNVKMATLGRPIATSDLGDLSAAKVVVDRHGFALYFSRLGIPFTRKAFQPGSDGTPVLKHIGIYGYQRSFLDEFCDQKPVPLEEAESLEQLRALWMGAKIKVVPTQQESCGVDTPEDVVRVESQLKLMGRA